MRLATESRRLYSQKFRYVPRLPYNPYYSQCNVASLESNRLPIRRANNSIQASFWGKISHTSPPFFLEIDFHSKLQSRVLVAHLLLLSEKTGVTACYSLEADKYSAESHDQEMHQPIV